MANICKIYMESIKKYLGYYAIWPIQTTFKLGDYGELINGQFKRRGNINDDYNINIEILESSTKNDMKFSDGINLNTNVETSCNQVKVNLKFNKNKGIYFYLEDCTNKYINNYEKVGNEILKLNSKSKWKESYVLISEIVEAKSSMIIVSNEKNGEIELTADVDASIKTFDFKPSMKFNISKHSGTAIEIIGEKGLTPLIKLSKVISCEFSEHDLNEYRSVFRNKMNKLKVALIHPLIDNHGCIGLIRKKTNISASITRFNSTSENVKLIDNRYMNRFINKINGNYEYIPKYLMLEDGNTIGLSKKSKVKILNNLNGKILTEYKRNRELEMNNRTINNGYKINIFKEI